MDALAFVDKAAKSKRQSVYALVGDEDFLKRQCRNVIVSLTLGDTDSSFAVSVYSGEKLDFSTVRNDLDTLPFLSSARVVIVENADPFVTAHRESLEKYVQKPSKVGVLMLDVKSFPETTKLAKALPDAAKIACKSPPAYKLPDWATKWAKSRHGKVLAPDAAGLLIELIGPQMGLLDQELEKLAVAVGIKPEITFTDVDRFVGRSRAANVFHILDAIGEGKPAKAFAILSEQFEDGEEAIKTFAALTSQLRKLAAVRRLTAQGESLGPAMDAADVPRWPQARQSFERQLRHLGRRRLDQLTEWLVEVDFGLKGGNPLPPRLQIERLIVKLAQPREKV